MIYLRNRVPSITCVAALLALLGGCAHGWGSSSSQATPAKVAAALGDETVPDETNVAVSLPDIKPPGSVRPCCAFGMDLQVSVNGKNVPGYANGNIIGVDEVGRHEYDNGAVTLQPNLSRLVLRENNGLVYTCRGGFVDTAHVRDNADLTLYLSVAIARELPGPVVLDVPGDGARRQLVIKPIAPAVLSRFGRLEVATTLAEWIAFQFSVWHEIASWYGLESVKGFSEKASTFSPEDLYSNVLGIKLAAGILGSDGVRSRTEYDSAVDAWLAQTLRTLDGVSKDHGRQAMREVDGVWWDSRKRLPDWTLVLRRQLKLEMPIAPWQVTAASTSERDTPAARAMCMNSRPPLWLSIPDHVGQQLISDLVTLNIFVQDWAPANLPYSDPAARRVSSADFPRIISVIHGEMESVLGPGFDAPQRRLTSSTRH